MESFLDDGFFDITQTWDDTIGGSTCVIVKDRQDREWLESVNPVWYKSLTDAGVSSIVLFPLENYGEIIGYMWALNFNEESTVKIKETLELTTFFIASELSNYQLLNKLEVMSTVDMLTGVKNRNAMNNDVSDILSGKTEIRYPYSVIFTDLNGLKRVNDESGHNEGDKILKKAANILSGVFFDADVYRSAMRVADERMYADKKAYYDLHPEKKYR